MLKSEAGRARHCNGRRSLAPGDRASRAAQVDELVDDPLAFIGISAAQSHRHLRSDMIAQLAKGRIGIGAQSSALKINVGYGRSEERRVGKECVRTCRSWWSADQ